MKIHVNFYVIEKDMNLWNQVPSKRETASHIYIETKVGYVSWIVYYFTMSTSHFLVFVKWVSSHSYSETPNPHFKNIISFGQVGRQKPWANDKNQKDFFWMWYMNKPEPVICSWPCDHVTHAS